MLRNHAPIAPLGIRKDISIRSGLDREQNEYQGYSQETFVS